MKSSFVVKSLMMFLPLSCIKWKESKTSTKTVEPQNSRPQLVVLVIVDQMRADYLDRFKPILLDQSNREVKGLLEFNQSNRPNLKEIWKPLYTRENYAGYLTSEWDKKALEYQFDKKNSLWKGTFPYALVNLYQYQSPISTSESKILFEMKALLNSALHAEFGEKGAMGGRPKEWVLGYETDQVYFNKSLMDANPA